MKRFDFRLQPLLNYRSYLEQVARQDSARAKLALVRCEKEILDLTTAHIRQSHEVAAFLARGMDGAAFLQHQLYLDALADSREHEQLNKVKLSGVLNEKLKVLKQKTIDRKVMELYRGRMREDYLKRMMAAEQKSMDEISALRTVRKLSDEPV